MSRLRLPKRPKELAVAEAMLSPGYVRGYAELHSMSVERARAQLKDSRAFARAKHPVPVKKRKKVR